MLNIVVLCFVTARIGSLTIMWILYVHCIGFIEATIEQSHQSAEVTTKVTFMCRASGYHSDMFSYQWRINQSDIDSATSSSYIIPSVNESEHGMYECVVTNHWNEMQVSAPVQLNITSTYVFYIYMDVYVTVSAKTVLIGTTTEIQFIA